MQCRQCTKPVKKVGHYVPPTCGRSECQEAEAKANAERAKPKKRKLQPKEGAKKADGTTWKKVPGGLEMLVLPKEPFRLRVWWIPQVPMKAFRVDVKTIDEAKLLLRALAQYDLFQLENNIKPDYANAGGLETFQDGDWCEWCDDETGDSISDVMRNERT
jgi:hypothetical protein